MSSNLLYSTIIFIGRHVPDDCLNTVVSVAVISEWGFQSIMTEIESLVCILIFALTLRGDEKKKSTPILSKTAYRP